MSSPQNNREKENALIHDQYFTERRLFIIYTPKNVFIEAALRRNLLLLWCIYLTVHKYTSESRDNYLANSNDNNYCFGTSSSAKMSINACCCGVNFQDAGTVVEACGFAAFGLSCG